MQTKVRRVQAVENGKPVIISETGQPDRGSAFHGSVPSRIGAMRYFVNGLCPLAPASHISHRGRWAAKSLPSVFGALWLLALLSSLSR
jgi:hypothetical protein